MKSRLFIFLPLLIVSVLCGGDSKPNIIFILSDDQRADSVGFMGNTIVRTPNLDALASDGTVFEQAYVTSAICTPSRATYMLGQFERRHGVNFNSGTAMAPEAWARSYPVLLREAGYFTGYIGKNHLPIGEQGYFTGLMERSFDFWWAGHHHLSFYSKEYHEIFDNAAADTQPEIVTEGALAFLDPESNEGFLENAVDFLTRRPSDQPFCLSIALNVPHGASVRTMEQRPTDDALYRTAYREWQETLPLPPFYTAKADIIEPKLPSDLLLADLRQTGYDWVDEPASVRDRVIRQYQLIEGIDRMIGELRAHLEELGIADNTIIIYASDHGLFSGEHGLGGKSLCYEALMHIPFIVYDPRLPAGHRGRRLSELVQAIDVAPTILSLAGIAPAKTMQGADLTPLLRGETAGWREYAFGENLWSNIFGNPRCETVRSAEYRYIRYFRNDNRALREATAPKDYYKVSDQLRGAYRKHLTSTITGEPVVYEELYHTASDPYEAVNLAGNPAYADILATLRDQCARLVAEAKGGVDTAPLTIPVGHEALKTDYRQL